MKKCPRCGYERTDKDDGFISKEECPRCGIYYAKFVEVVTSGNGEDTFGAIRKDRHEDEQRGETQISLDNKTKKCPFCAEVIQSEAIKCKHCGEWLDKKDEPTLDKNVSTGNISTPAGSSSSQQSAVTTQPPKKQNVNESSKFLGDTYHPWRRYFARMVDYSTGGLLAIFVVGFIFGLLFPDKVEGLTKVTVFTKASNYLTIVIIADLVLMIIWMPIEAVLLSTAGNTFGKLLFGISVRTTSGQILSFSQALERSWGVLLKGMALGIPFVLLVTQYFAYKRLTETGTTLWDTGTNCIVTHKTWSTARTIACVGTTIVVFVLVSLLGQFYKDTNLSGRLVNYGSKSGFVDPGYVPEAPAPPAPEAATVPAEAPKVEVSVAPAPASTVKAPYTLPEAYSYLNYAVKGDRYSKSGQYQLAIEEYNKAISLKPDYAWLYNGRGHIYYQFGHHQRAIEDYTEAIRLDQNDAMPYNNRGVTYDKLGQYQLAINDYNKAISLKPDNESYYNNRGVIYGKLGQYQLAINDYNKAISLKPDDTSPYINRAITYRNLGQYKLAIEDISKAISLNPGEAHYYNLRGKLYLMQRNNVLCCYDAQKACELGNCKLLEEAKNMGFCR